MPGDERRWRSYFLRQVWVFGFLLAGTYAFIVLADPFDVLPLSLDFQRKPVTTNQRYAYPALARKAAFDSCVIGTSSVRLLDPDELNRHLGGAFVNLAMDLATRYEQRALLDVFLRHHPRPRTVVLAVDEMWIDAPNTAMRYGHHAFPAWMYDEDPWNDYAHHWDLWTLKQAWRQALQAFGLTTPRYRPDGYARFVPAPADYDLEKVLAKIAERGAFRIFRRPDGTRVPYHFALDELVEVLRAMPPSTETVLILPPFYRAAEIELTQGKRDLVEAVRPFENVRVVDFMIESPLTTTETNWWDPVHFTVDVASEISRLLAVSRDADFESEDCRGLLSR